MPARLRERSARGSTLAQYARLFGCVEINSSFYRSHRVDTYRRWAAEVRPAFRFSVKLPQTITHDRGLRGASRLLDAFLAEVAGLGAALGPLLIQLPASRPYERAVASRFLEALRVRHSGPVVLEPRHASWFAEAATEALLRHRIGRVAADPAPTPSAVLPLVADRLAYFRWHGSPRMYWTRYGEARLEPLAREALALARGGVEVWCVLDNTASQAAAHDALALQSMTRSRLRAATRTARAAPRARAR